jgi:tetratricopeptide (TPR) repeat protein
MIEGAVDVWDEFEALRSRGLEAIEEGRLDEAEQHWHRALHLAREHGDQRHVDLAICTLATSAIHRGRGEGELPLLREILLRGSDVGNCRLAAYNISVHYQFAKNYKKSAFYARIALDRARLLARQDWLASCHNQLGNALLCESMIEEATREYRQALDLVPEEASLWRALILDNLGYCRILQGHHREGYPLLYQSLRMLRQVGVVRQQAVVLLDLCFAHLETGRFRPALRCGVAGLAIAERTGQGEHVKNALYLVGEATNLSGAPELARSYFTRLQQKFYPDDAYLPGFLLAVDIRKLINLHA